MQNSNTALLLKQTGTVLAVVAIAVAYFILGLIYGGVIGDLLIIDSPAVIIAGVVYIEWAHHPMRMWPFAATIIAGIAALAVDGLMHLPWGELSPFGGPARFWIWTACALLGAYCISRRLYDRDFAERPARQRPQQY